MLTPGGGVLQARPDPRWREVDSTCLSHVRYVGDGWLDVRFRQTREEYRYIGLTVEQFWALVNAPSVGEHYNAFIKYAFDWVKLT